MRAVNFRFWFRRESDKSGKTARQKKKKNQIVGSFNSISTTCKFEIDFFFTTRKKSLCRAYVTQSSLERPFHVAREMSSEREFRCTVLCMSQFHCGNEVKQGHKVQTNKL